MLVAGGACIRFAIDFSNALRRSLRRKACAQEIGDPRGCGRIDVHGHGDDVPPSPRDGCEECAHAERAADPGGGQSA
jgi:hypothetical protein